jgi:hypothetical protein
MQTKQTAKAKPELVNTEVYVEVEKVKVVESIKEDTQKKLKDTWEIKDRTYVILDGDSPLTYTLQARHTLRYPLIWFDKKTGNQEELRYATNQNSPLVSEQKGQATLGHIIFENGILNVPKEKQNLQKLLSMFHPALNKRYMEFDPVAEASDDLEDMDIQLDAMNAAREMDIDQAEAILRVDIGSKVSKMTSKEIKRDLMLFAKNNPSLFLELANDENVHLRNIAIRGTEEGIIKLTHDNRTFLWGENDRKLMTVPFDENPYSAMAAFFKTDEGMGILGSIEKKLK